jgi:uncharacterized LabA/DUF88 family protein
MDEQEKRVLLVVDVQNIFFSARNIYGKGIKIDFGKMLNYFKQVCPLNYVITEKLAFVVSTNQQESRGFRLAIQKKHGFTVFSKTVPADRVAGGPDDPGTDWDVGLALKTSEKMFKWSGRNTNMSSPAFYDGDFDFDVLLLVSGDGDFVDLVKYLRERRPNVQVEVASFRSSMSSFLIKMVDHFYELDDSIVLIPKL